MYIHQQPEISSTHAYPSSPSTLNQQDVRPIFASSTKSALKRSTPSSSRLSAPNTTSTSSRLKMPRSLASGLVCARLIVRVMPARLLVALALLSRIMVKRARPCLFSLNTSKTENKLTICCSLNCRIRCVY